MLVEERPEQAFEIGAYRDCDGGRRVAIESHEEFIKLFDTFLDDSVVTRFLDQRHGEPPPSGRYRCSRGPVGGSPQQSTDRTASTAIRPAERRIGVNPRP